jgi:hypothetical protein
MQSPDEFVRPARREQSMAVAQVAIYHLTQADTWLAEAGGSWCEIHLFREVIYDSERPMEVVCVLGARANAYIRSFRTRCLLFGLWGGCRGKEKCLSIQAS